MRGGKEAIVATAKIMPKLVVKIFDCFIKGDIEKAGPVKPLSEENRENLKKLKNIRVL